MIHDIQKLKIDSHFDNYTFNSPNLIQPIKYRSLFYYTYFNLFYILVF